MRTFIYLRYDYLLSRLRGLHRRGAHPGLVAAPCKSARGFFGDQRGVTAVFIGLAATGLVGFTGLAVDVGSWRYAQRNMQGAADNAAYSAALLALQAPASQTQATTKAQATTQAQGIAAQMGFANGQKGASVALNNPPLQGALSGQNSAYEVVIQQPQQLLLAKLFLASGPNVSARAVGALARPKCTNPANCPGTDGKTPGQACIWTLDPHMSGALHVEGGDAITTQCGSMVNSDSSTAATIDGSLNVPAATIVGNYTGTINSPNITTGAGHLPDPLAYLAPPPVGAGCNQTNYSKSSGSVTLNPGIYCGGITVSGSANVTFNPGTYILKGGLNASGSAHLTGAGVTFYNTFDATHPYKPVMMLDNVVSDLSAPTSGSMEGLLFFQDRAAPVPPCLNNNPPQGNVCGNILVGKLTGAMYFATTGLLLNSQQDVVAPYSIFVANWINLSVNTLHVTNDFSSLFTGSPIRIAKVAE